jgi:adenylate cyclase
MGQEIERKFLVTGDGWRPLARRVSVLRQGYLSSNAKATVRVRLVDDARGFLTLKGAARGRSRAEYEYEIPVDDAVELLEMARPHVVEKRRHIVPFAGLDWEIDVFEGRHAGLVIAEVELEHVDQPVALPDWVGAEVTEDDRYANASLSRSDLVPGVDPDAT